MVTADPRRTPALPKEMNTLLFAAVVARDKDGFDLFGVEDARQAHGCGDQQVQSARPRTRGPMIWRATAIAR